MGPEELAIIMSPQFINATFRAGEDWYYGMLARTQEANRLAQHRHSFEVANARYAVVNHQLLHDAREQNAKWKAFANDLVRKHDDYAALAKRLLDEEIADRQAEAKAKRAVEQQLADEKASSAGKDNEIAQLKQDWNWFSDTLDTTHAALTSEQQKVAAITAENGTIKVALQTSEGEHQAALTELKMASEKVAYLEVQRRNAMSVTLAVEAAGMAVMYVTAQAIESWAAQGKAPMLDNLMTSHFKDGGHPMTMREYLWFATLIKEMRERNIPDYLIHCRCKVDGIEDFLERNPHISEVKVDAKAV